MKKAIFYIIYTFLFGGWLLPGDTAFKIQHIGRRDGLSHSGVYCIMQDSAGFIWLATGSGLLRHDGYDFRVFKHDPDRAHSLPDNHINYVYEDRAGMMWVGTRDSGLIRFDREGEKFFVHFADAAAQLGLPGNEVRTIFEDSLGGLWVGTGDGLIYIDWQRETSIRYRADASAPGSLSSGSVWVIHEDRSGTLWVGTEGGLNRLDRQTGQFCSYRPEPGNPGSLSGDFVTSMGEDRQGTLWIGTTEGLNRFDSGPEKFYRYRRDPSTDSGLSADIVSAIREDMKGNLWVGIYRGGLHRLDREHEKFIPCSPEHPGSRMLGTAGIFSLIEDRTGILWIGTEDKGVFKLIPRRKRFDHFKIEPASPPGAKSNIVCAFQKDRQGVLWVGTYNGLFRRERQQSRFIYFPLDPLADRRSADALVMNVIPSLLEDRSGRLWIGTSGRGLLRLDPAANKIDRYRTDTTDPHSLSGDFVRVIYEDKEGTLWIGTEGDGLNRFNPGEGKFFRYRADKRDASSLSHDFVMAIREDDSGVLWIGTYGGGLDRFDPESGTFVNHKYVADNPANISHNFIYALCPGGKGVLWVGTNGSGLGRYDTLRNKYTFYTEKQGLADNAVYGILPDRQGNLWISTNRGLSRFDPHGETFQNYSAADGLQSDEFMRGASYRDEEGRLFFGGMNGFNRFFPARIKDNPHTPPLVLTGFSLLNRSLPEGGEAETGLRKSEDGNYAVALKYWQHSFSFQFTALDYTIPEKNRYAYMLEGRDHGWIELGTRRRVSFSRLEPGNYILRVKGSNNDGVWNRTGLSVKIVISPPFWKTWWFRLLLGAIVLASVLLLYRLRIKFLRRRLEQAARLDLFCRKFNISPREREIIQLMLQGKSNRDIEEELYISMNTVKSHIFSIYRKLGIKNRVQLVNLLAPPAGNGGELRIGQE